MKTSFQRQINYSKVCATLPHCHTATLPTAAAALVAFCSCCFCCPVISFSSLSLLLLLFSLSLLLLLLSSCGSILPSFICCWPFLFCTFCTETCFASSALWALKSHLHLLSRSPLSLSFHFAHPCCAHYCWQCSLKVLLLLLLAQFVGSLEWLPGEATKYWTQT